MATVDVILDRFVHTAETLSFLNGTTDQDSCGIISECGQCLCFAYSPIFPVLRLSDTLHFVPSLRREVHLRTERQICPHWEMNQIARGIARGHCCLPRDFCENWTWLLRPHGRGLTVEWGVIILLPASAPHANMPERPVSKRYHTVPLTLCQGDCPRAPYPRLRCVDWNRAGHTSPTGRINCFSFGKT